MSGLSRRDIHSRSALNHAEAENILDALTKYLGGKPDQGLAPFDLAWCYQLHHEMFGRVWNWAGRKRDRDLNLGIAHYQIDAQLHELMADLRYWREHHTMPVAEQAAHLHHRAVAIHPFLNGNGRWSRLLANIWLARESGLVVMWPEEVIGTVSTVRDEYIAALRAADRGDLGPLTHMQARYFAPLEE